MVIDINLRPGTPVSINVIISEMIEVLTRFVYKKGTIDDMLFGFDFAIQEKEEYSCRLMFRMFLAEVGECNIIEPIREDIDSFKWFSNLQYIDYTIK